MLRYIAAAGIAILLLAVALKSRAGAAAVPGEAPAALTVSHERPLVEAARNPDGSLTIGVRHTLAASVSRVSLVYDADGGERLLDKTDCQRSLRRAATTVTLGGNLPPDARDVRLVVEDETGTTVVPVPLD